MSDHRGCCAASRCSMALRVASLTPYTLQLCSLELENLAGGWALLHTSGAELQAAPHTMHCDDVLSLIHISEPTRPY